MPEAVVPTKEYDVVSESKRAQSIRNHLERLIVNQKEAVDALIDILEKFHSNLYDQNKPIGNLLFLGPTGTGKTYICESLCEILFNNPKALIKIDCAEFQHSHEIAKLIGSPPGYLGHTETPARFKQETLDQFHTTDYPFTIVLFDEIEKANDTLWQMLLGILDKGTLTLGNNKVSNFNKTIIIMTSNLGSIEMANALSGGLGFNTKTRVSKDKIKNIGNTAARKKFTPEFINRLDSIVTFNSLSKGEISKILDIELEKLQIMIAQRTIPLLFDITEKAKKVLVNEGYDPKYNGRHIKRAIDVKIKVPLSKIIVTEQNHPFDRVLIDFQKGKFKFFRVPGIM